MQVIFISDNYYCVIRKTSNLYFTAYQSISPTFLIWFISWSMIRLKCRGLSESPCLIPVDIGISGVSSPFTNILVDVARLSCCITSIMVFGTCFYHFVKSLCLFFLISQITKMGSMVHGSMVLARYSFFFGYTAVFICSWDFCHQFHRFIRLIPLYFAVIFCSLFWIWQYKCFPSIVLGCFLLPESYCIELVSPCRTLLLHLACWFFCFISFSQVSLLFVLLVPVHKRFLRFFFPSWDIGSSRYIDFLFAFTNRLRLYMFHYVWFFF